MSARFGARMIARTNRAALEEAYERLGSGNKGLFLAALPVRGHGKGDHDPGRSAGGVPSINSVRCRNPSLSG